MSPTWTRRLLAIHRVCGLIVAANLIVLAGTGLVLVFHDEIDHALGVMPRAQGEARMSAALAIGVASQADPLARPVFVFQDPDHSPGVLFVGMSRGERKLALAKPVAVDTSTGALLANADPDATFTGKVLKLHSELFLGGVGRLLVGLFAVVFLTSLISGVLVYGETMKRFVFGMIRRDRSARTRRADLHKLLGIATLGWTFLVVSTGLMLTLGNVALQIFSATELAAIGAPFANDPPVSDYRTIDAAARAVEAATPGYRWSLVALPGSDLASPRHYTVLSNGGLHGRMLTMALVDAREPSHVEKHEIPWYLRALVVSEPLHFGDYGGLPLKLVWSAFALLTMGIAGSGLFSFAARKQARVPAAVEGTMEPSRRGSGRFLGAFARPAILWLLAAGGVLGAFLCDGLAERIATASAALGVFSILFLVGARRTRTPSASSAEQGDFP